MSSSIAKFYCGYFCKKCNFEWESEKRHFEVPEKCPYCRSKAVCDYYGRINNRNQFQKGQRSQREAKPKEQQEEVENPIEGEMYGGEFYCRECSESWVSIRAIKDKKEKCERCELKWSPFRFFELTGLEIDNDIEVENPVVGKRYFGKFKCTHCKNNWENYHAFFGVKQKCEKCKKGSSPKKFYNLKNIQMEVLYPVKYKRYYGEFFCGNCNSSWNSASSFCNFRQACSRRIDSDLCGNYEFPNKQFNFEERIEREVAEPEMGKEYYCEFFCKKCPNVWREMKEITGSTFEMCRKKNGKKKCGLKCNARRFFEPAEEELKSKKHHEEECERCQKYEKCVFNKKAKALIVV